MEEQLDQIEENGKDWKELIAAFYPPFEEKVRNALKGSIEVSDTVCEKCGANMVVKVGKYGKFLACPNYPDCKNIKSLDEPEVSDEKCDKCGADMVYRRGKYGRYLACSNYPQCKNMKAEGEEKTDKKCPGCGGALVLRNGKFGKYLYCAECKKIISDSEKVGVCPKCGKDVVKKFTKSRKIFYGCSDYPQCDFASWDIPSDKKCPECGGYMVIKENKKGKRLVCADKNCGYGEDLEN
jgi:DNA topoisomerase-1